MSPLRNLDLLNLGRPNDLDKSIINDITMLRVLRFPQVLQTRTLFLHRHSSGVQYSMLPHLINPAPLASHPGDNDPNVPLSRHTLPPMFLQ